VPDLLPYPGARWRYLSPRPVEYRWYEECLKTESRFRRRNARRC